MGWPRCWRRNRPPPHLGDPPASDLDRLAAGDDALGRRGREPGAQKLDHLLDCEAVREQDRLGAAVAARRKQFERAALLDICAALDHEAILMTTYGIAS